VNYSRWWLDAVVDNEEVIRTFVSAQHEKRIRDFKALDDRFTDLTRSYVRACCVPSCQSRRVLSGTLNGEL
jgi:hypothetical protein